MLQAADRQAMVPASRIRAPRRQLKPMRRLLIQLARARQVRASTEVEVWWCGLAEALIGFLVYVGDERLPWFKDPSTRKVRKRR